MAQTYDELKRYFPRPFYQLKDDEGLAILLEIFGFQLDDLKQQMMNARAQFLLESAEGAYLEQHGVNRDVFKPKGIIMTDTSYRELIKVLTNTPKNIMNCFYEVLEILFGEGAIDKGLVQFYSIDPKVVTVRWKAESLIAANHRTLYGTTYLHVSPSNPYTPGLTKTYWLSLSAAQANVNTSTIVMMTVPPDMPDSGMIKIGPDGGTQEYRAFKRVGSIVTIQGKLKHTFPVGTLLKGLVNPDSYPSAYLYQPELKGDLIDNYPIGSTVLTLNTVAARFPTEGLLTIEEADSDNFEVRGFTRSGLTITLASATEKTHNSGVFVYVPNLIRSDIKTSLNDTIAAGATGRTQITVINGADFATGVKGVMMLDRSGNNEEIVPFWGRAVGNNQLIYTDPSYVFLKNHAPGEKVHLMSGQTTIAVDGTNWPFYLVDVEAFKATFFGLLSRIKAVGTKLNFEVLS